MSKERVPQYMLDHFAEDRKAFGRYDELLSISGEHMSHIRKDLTDSKNTIDRILTVIEDNSKRDEEHRTRVEPVIKAYEDSLVIKANNDRLGKRIINYGAIGTAVIILGGIIMTVIRKFI